MRQRCMRTLTLLVVLTASAFAEVRDIKLANALAPRNVQELATILRTVVGVQILTIENGVVHVDALVEQVDMCEFIVNRFDKPAGWLPSEQERKNPSARNYRDVVRIYYLDLPAAGAIQSMQETLTVLRTVLDVQRIFNYTSHQALTVRGTGPELEAIEWLLTAMAKGTSSEPYKLQGAALDTVRVFALPADTSAATLSNTLKALRTDLHIQKVFNVTAPPIIVARAAAADLDLVAKRLQ
ncbi:MAG: hypothetical protein JWN34_5977 [Bryobacterales bacterium]|nr:hypothetical protein [Bryobacterales bacterium]